MGPTPTSMRAIEHMDSGSSGAGCSYTDGPQYVGCQVAARGLPTPQYMSGGKRKRKMSKRRRKSRGKRAGSLVRNIKSKSHKKRSSRRYRR